MEEFVVVVTGSRHWLNEAQIKERIKQLASEARRLKKQLVLVQGGAPGVDRMVRHWGEVFGAKVITEEADWNNKGYFDKGAGLRRNIFMLEAYKPRLLLAFRAAGKSNGTDHCIEEAKKRDITVEINYENSSQQTSSRNQ